MLLPLGLAFAGICLLIGCFLLPGPEKGTQGVDFRGIVGTSGSGKTLQTGLATREKVLAVLGEPKFRAVDNRAEGYLLETHPGIWLQPLCFSAQPRRRFYLLRLEYDEHDVVKGFKVTDVEGEFGFYGVGYGAMQSLEKGFQEPPRQVQSSQPSTGNP